MTSHTTPIVCGIRRLPAARTPRPAGCIDCDACVEAYPVDACFAEDQLPDEWQKHTQVNADYDTRRG
jgi:ferredoxin